MKNFVKYLYALVLAAFVAVSCDIVPVEEKPYEPGTPDLENCAGVYFPEQANTGDHVLDPADPTSLAFTVKRTNTEGQLAVPVTVTANHEDIFVLSSIVFNDGEDEADLTVNFPSADVGVKYTCTVEVVGDEYVSKYTANSAYVSFSVIREKWNDLGMATFTDDLFGGLYGSYMPPVTYQIQVLENDLKPGMYRLIDPYKNHPNGDVIGAYYSDTKTIIEIDATNPNAIILADQFTGMGSEEDGWYYIWSMAGYYKAKGGDPSEYYGKLENGIITFPSRGLLLHCTLYNPTSLFYANTNGAFKIKLPGAVEYDYSLDVAAGESQDGVMPVYFAMGSDIAKVKYALAEGVLDNAGIDELAEAIAAGTVESAEVVESGIYAITAEETGKYTLVAVGYDESGTPQAVEAVSFGYVAAGDEVPVVLSCTLETTEKWTARGYTPANSLEYAICGEDLTDVKFGLYSDAVIEKYGMDLVIEDVLDGDSIDEDELELVNEAILSDIFVGLKSFTGYTLVVWASNGYESKVVTAGCSTEGLPLELIGTGTFHYDGFWAGDDEGLELYFDPNTGKYSIDNMFYGVTFEFEVDEKGIISFDPTYTGYANILYVLDCKDIWDDDWVAAYVNAGYMTEEEAAHIYDPSYVDANGVFNFHTTYYANGYGIQVWGWETFTLDAAELSSASSKKVVGKLVKRQVQLPEVAVPGIFKSARTAGIKARPSVKAVSFKASRVTPSGERKSGRVAAILK